MRDVKMTINWFTIRSAVISSIGGYAFGIDGGIIATTIGHKSFLDYMFPPSGKNAPVLGAIVAIYSAGCCIGNLVVGPLADKISRRWSIAFSGMFATVGGILMCAAQNPAMMIVGRLFAGFAAGINIAVIPVYISEISVPASRGIMVGIQGTSIAVGYCLANWIGYAGEFAKGNAQWRIPLGVQCFGTLLIGLAPIFLPYTPRWLIQKDRIEEARAVLSRLHAAEGEAFISKELVLIRSQIHFEAEIRKEGFLNNIRDLCSKRYRRRFICAVWIMVMTANMSGVAVIQNYQTEFYNLVGYTGNSALLVSAIYGLMGVLGQVINITLVADKRGRKSTMWIGSFVLVICNIITMAMTATVGTSKPKGEVAIAFIFIYSGCYAIFFNSTNYLIISEIFPFHLRAVGFGVSNFIGNCIGITLAQVSPLAFDGIGWKYYIVFIVASILSGFFYLFFMPETKGLNLEEIAAVFGDVVVSNGKESIVEEDRTKAPSAHVEDVEK